MKWILGLALLVAGGCCPASAYTNGNDMRENCSAALDKQTQSGARAGLCLGFLDAYRQLAVMLPTANPRPVNWLTCKLS